MEDRGKPRSRAGVWPVGRRAQAVPVVPGLTIFADAALARLRVWAAQEAAPGRLLIWLAVAFGLGVALYFTAAHEPQLWAAALAFAGASAVVIAFRQRGVSVLIALGIAAVAAGFFLATLRASRLDHPILQRPAFGATLTGFVEAREERERSDRIVLRIHTIEGTSGEKLQRVRIAVRKGTAPPVGSFVALKARLSPPPAPLRPGGYDFARDLYFHRIGAVGFALGKITTAAAPLPPDLRLRAAAWIDQLRDGIDRRIRMALTGDARAIAAALITGKRDAISSPVNDAMYVSSLAHVLSISGYHMAVVAGVVFFLLRAVLALNPTLAEHAPIKKWAAAAALFAAAFYLVLSGAEVATQRAFVMTAIVLAGVMLDRSALTLRTLAIAALVVMVATPEAIVHPSFQMSFAATLALIATYERGLPWILSGGRSSLGARVALWGGREIVALVLASLVAGLATTPYAAYHFHRVAPYGVIANLLAMPVISGFVMPVGLFAVAAMPFGFDGPLWWLMGVGIDWMTGVALWTAGLPGAVGRMSAFGVVPLLAATLGLIMLCLLRSPLRFAGVALLVIAAMLALATPRPDVLVAANGEAVAVRGGADGRLSVLTNARRSFAVRDWLAADGDPRASNEPALADGWSCDPVGCIAKLADGAVVAMARSAAAFADDCTRAALIITMRDPPADCAAAVIDRDMLQRSGSLALTRAANGWKVVPARKPGEDRPWARAPGATPPRAAASGSPGNMPRDATPVQDDLELGD